jgi:hypothetical protein
MEDSDFNTLLKELRSCLMPTRPIEGIFNLTFDVDRPKYKSNGMGGQEFTGWDRVDSNKRGALDDKCEYVQLMSPGGLVDDTEYTLYCDGKVNIKPRDRVTLKLDDKQDEELIFTVKVIRNPMMRYRYLVVLCRRGG